MTSGDPPHQPARHVRYHQADKGDRTDNRGRAAAQYGNNQQANKLCASDFTTKRGSCVAPEAQAIQGTTEEQCDSRGNQYWYQYNLQRLQAADIQ